MVDAVSHEEREQDERDSSSVVVVVAVIIDELPLDDVTEGADVIVDWSPLSSRGMVTRDVSSASSRKVAMIARARHDWMGSPPRPCSIGG